MTTASKGPEGDSEVEIDDDALDLAAGGSGVNATSGAHASTFIPFDSSF
jgi:hypothetical protein